MNDADLELARKLQEEFDREAASNFTSPTSVSSKKIVSKSPLSIIDPQWELTDPNPDIRALFLQYNERFFWGRLAEVEVKWSPRMTLCAGICCYEGYGGLCSVRLSTPLLKLRPRKDLVETLLHEMIHAYLFVTQNNKDHDGHGPEFQKHMNRINKETGTSISIYHNFHDEVAHFRQHWWRCDGPCRSRPPYFGYVKRSMNRAPAPRDTWWGEHVRSCGGSYTKVKEPEGYGQKKNKKDKDKDGGKEDTSAKPKSSSGPDLRSFWGQGSTGTKSKPPGKPSSTVTSGQNSSNNPSLPSLSISSDEDDDPGRWSKQNGSLQNKNNNSTKSIAVPAGKTFINSIWDESVGMNGIPKKTSIPSKTSTNTSKGPSIKTIWDEKSDTNESKTNDSKLPSGGPQICDINTVDNFQKESKTSFGGEGHTLGNGQGQGLSFLAQLRREMNNKNQNQKLYTSSFPKEDHSNNLSSFTKSQKSKDKTMHGRLSDQSNSPSPTKTITGEKGKYKSTSKSPGKRKRELSPEKDIEEWFSKKSPGTRPCIGGSTQKSDDDWLTSGGPKKVIKEWSPKKSPEKRQSIGNSPKTSGDEWLTTWNPYKSPKPSTSLRRASFTATSGTSHSPTTKTSGDEWLTSPYKSPKPSNSPRRVSFTATSGASHSPTTKPLNHLWDSFSSDNDTKNSAIISDDDELEGRGKPLFKKVNPASNFTSPPFKRISLYNKDSSSKSSGTNSVSELAEGSGIKRKHSSQEVNAKDKSKFKSWTSKPQYSTSDDSETEIFQPAKKFKTGNKDRTKSGKGSNTNYVIPKLKKKDNNKKDEGASKSGSRGGNLDSKGNNSGRNEQGGGNSVDSNDPLQSCPVCQKKVPASQINHHLDQCLSFG